MSLLLRVYLHTSGFFSHSKSILFPCLGLAILLTLSSCEKKGSSVIDPLGSPPFISTASVTPNVVNLDTLAQGNNLAVTVTAMVHQTAYASTITSVSCSLVDSSGSDVLAAGQLADNGVFPDVTAGDSMFTGQIVVPVAALYVSNFHCEVEAQSPEGFHSNTFLLPLRIYRQANRPPVLSELSSPDTISFGRKDTIWFPLSVKAIDPDGQSDIAKVFFNSFKPDGSPAGGNPFQMYDDGSQNSIPPYDGSSGDLVKGDGIFTLSVLIDSSNAKGTYRFEFQAVDRSSAYSNKLTKFIVVTP